MADATQTLLVATAFLLGLTALAATGLRAWQEWLGLRRLRIVADRGPQAAPGSELDEIRRRVKRLEAIASGGPD